MLINDAMSFHNDIGSLEAGRAWPALAVCVSVIEANLINFANSRHSWLSQFRAEGAGKLSFTGGEMIANIIFR